MIEVQEVNDFHQALLVRESAGLDPEIPPNLNMRHVYLLLLASRKYFNSLESDMRTVMRHVEKETGKHAVSALKTG